MPKKILSDVDMAEARRLYEREGMGYGRLAKRFGVATATTQSWVRRGGWQRDQGVAPQGSGEPRYAGAANDAAKFTEVPAGGPGKGGMHTSPRAESAPAARPALAPVDPVGGDVAERPEFPNAAEEMKWIEQQVGARQDALVKRFDVEIKALTSRVYGALKQTGEGAFNAARTAERLGVALEKKQKLELANEELRTRRELGEHYGAGPRPAIIIVHTIEGFQLGENNEPAAIAGRAEARKVIEAARRELVAAGLKPIQVLAAISRIRGGAAPDGEVVDVDAAIVGVEGA